jgi:omega-6 fatty acid desaturase (delta-12 desaturase)
MALGRQAVNVEADADRAAAAAIEWRRSLPPERRSRSTLRGWMYFLPSALAYVVLFAGACLAPAWWLQALCVVALPFVMGSLFVIGHDAAHHSLVPSRRANQVIGQLALLPEFHPFSSWSHAHNTLHHGGTCLKGMHPDFPPLSKDEFDRLAPWRQRLERVYRSPIGPGLAYMLDFYAGYLLFPDAAHAPVNRWRFHRDRLLVAAFQASLLSLAYVLPGGSHGILRAAQAVAIVFVPWLLWMTFMGVVSFIQHTHPATAWYDDPSEWQFHHVQLRSSTHMVLPGRLGAFLHNILDHPAHHLDPTIPLYELAASQSDLERRAPEHSVVVPLTFREYLRICRTCKLYDYRRHCWLDFDGVPTTATGLNVATPVVRA